MGFIGRIVALYTRLNAKYWVRLAERSYSKGGDCIISMITDCPEGSPHFSEYFEKTSARYAHALPPGWKVSHGITRHPYLSSVFRPRTIYFHTVIFYDPSRCPSLNQPATY